MTSKETKRETRERKDRIYAANYGDATPKQVAAALLKYRPKAGLPRPKDADEAKARQP